ncbi:MAG: ATP-binding protein, partial [Desulfobacteraceae bacterium]|nr:ATP-binding protein [Desulfobacteraceae bacterium]
GTGVISAVTQLCQKKIIESGGAFKKNINLLALNKDDSGKIKYDIAPDNAFQDGSAIFISQKDIRSVQLGKGALITGIEFLLKEAGLEKAEKIIIAGAFGSFLDKEDMMALGMIPTMDLSQIEVAGNSAGAGAIMVLCDKIFLEKAIQIASKVIVVDLACNQDFQNVFVQNLAFPVLKN